MRKKQIYERYLKAFADLPLTMNPYYEGSEPNFWLSCILVNADCDVHPWTIMDSLAKENIESRPIWKPMHMQPVFAHCDFISVQEPCVGEDIFNRGLCLPSDIKMTQEDQERVIQAVRACFGR